MATFSLEQIETKANSIYELILVAARRAAQLAHPDTRPLVETTSKKPTVIALQEILEDKVKIVRHEDEEDAYME